MLSERPADFLKNFKGYLHADGYSGYQKLPEEITVVGCWVHARRKFDDVLKGMSEKVQAGSLTLRAKQYCDRLFEMKRQFIDLSADECYLKRQELSKPLMEEFFRWLRAQHASAKSAFGNAANYVIGRQKYLARYLLDGRLLIYF